MRNVLQVAFWVILAALGLAVAWRLRTIVGQDGKLESRLTIGG